MAVFLHPIQTACSKYFLRRSFRLRLRNTGSKDCVLGQDDDPPVSSQCWPPGSASGVLCPLFPLLPPRTFLYWAERTKKGILSHVIIDYPHFCTGLRAVFWIRIRMDPKLLPGSGIFVPDPAKHERADKYKCYFSLNSGLCVLKNCSMK